MFVKKNFYLYGNLYFDQDVFDKVGLVKIKSFDLMILLQDYEEFYKLDNGNLTKHNKNDLNYGTYGDKEFCYLIRDNNIIIVSIDMYYGIANSDVLLICSSNKEYRDYIFSQVAYLGINDEFVDNMDRSRNVVDEYNKQQKLIKTYNDLNNI